MRAMKTQFDGKTIKVPKQLRNAPAGEVLIIAPEAPAEAHDSRGWLVRKKPPSPRSGTTMRIQSMTPYKPGEVVLVRFPFSDLSTAKQRPALVISVPWLTLRYGDVIVLAMTSQPQREVKYRISQWRICRAAQADLVQAGDWHTCLHLDPTPYRSVARCRFSASPSRPAPDGCAGVFEIARRSARNGKPRTVTPPVSSPARPPRRCRRRT